MHPEILLTIGLLLITLHVAHRFLARDQRRAWTPAERARRCQ